MKTESVTNLKRQAIKILTELRETKEPVLIIEHGKPSAYLVDFEDFEQLQSRMRILEGIAQGQAAALEGSAMSHAKARKNMSKWLS